MEEPSVLDYVKSKLRLRKDSTLEIPWEKPGEEILEKARPEPPEPETKEESQDRALAAPVALPWRGPLALLLALVAQFSLGPRPERAWRFGVVMLIFSLAFLVWATLEEEWQAAPLPEPSAEVDPLSVNFISLLIGLFLALISFISFGNLKFSIFNLTLLLLSLVFVIVAFYVPPRQPQRWKERLSELLSRRQWPFSLSASTLLALTTLGVVLFFRFYRLNQVPPEMNSDHAEKILDITRVLAGDTKIFFPTNGGREALQFYLAAALHRLTGMELNFTILKVVTASVGFLALVFVYRLGSELGNRRIGLLAFLFAGVAYWPNVVSRVGLRLPFYMLFTATTLYFLLRGIRTGRQNDFILGGISLGLGFYGYSGDRILPLLVVVAVGLFLIHTQSTDRRWEAVLSTLALALVSFVLFIPLLSYILAEPDSFLFRTLTRMGNLERPIAGPVWLTFLYNMRRALAMFSWDNGEVWPISIPHYPALGIVSGALFYMGAGLLFLRYLQKRHWLDLFMLLSIPILMLPSVLALAFPAENPNLYRTGGAMVPVFLMVAIALDSLMSSLSARMRSPWGRGLAYGLAIFLLAFSSFQNYNLVFDEYYQQYRRSAWNTSEMGEVVRGFVDSVGNRDRAWVMGYPHWVDTRLVGINASHPEKDYQLFVEGLEATQGGPGPKLYLVNPQDQAAVEALEQLYPQGWFQLYKSNVETKDFLIFFVPPEGNN